MPVLYAFINGVTRLNAWIGRIASLLIFAMFGILLLGVFYRYALDAPTVWTTELTQFLFGLYAVLSGGYVMAHRGHVNVDIVYARFSPRARAVLDIITSVLFFLFTGAVLYFGGLIAWESIDSMETTYSSWNPPVYPFKAAIPVAAFLLLLQGLAKLFEDIAIALGRMTPEPDNAEHRP
ncbi:TRAP transporter small permease subunit [Salinisphaera aquimarina]|uniref:TRAP transporter small permease protein n=1 Tax=Salinisphaera aquimarina TaxID=2094031 RepID=A0ABV7EWD6_9GAMM